MKNINDYMKLNYKLIVIPKKILMALSILLLSMKS